MRPWGAAMGMYVVGCTKLYPSTLPLHYNSTNLMYQTVSFYPFLYIRTLKTVSSYPSLTLQPYKLHSSTCVRSRRRAICGQCPPATNCAGVRKLAQGSVGGGGRIHLRGSRGPKPRCYPPPPPGAAQVFPLCEVGK